MAPAVVLRGRPEAIEYYDTLLAELVEREKLGYSAVPGERMRLYWDGMPVWGRLRMPQRADERAQGGHRVLHLLQLLDFRRF